MESKSNHTEVSSGGFVISKSDPTLVALMARFNRGGKLEWCIPKGHLEQDETSEQAALREVFEETGLEAQIIQHLGEVNYQFIQDGSKISKTVHVYLKHQAGVELSFDKDLRKVAAEWSGVRVPELMARRADGNERRIAKLARELRGG